MQTDTRPAEIPTPNERPMSETTATLLVVVTSILMGSVPVFARELTDAGLSAVSVSFYRNLLGAVVLFRLLRFDGARRSATLWALGAGFGMLRCPRPHKAAPCCGRARATPWLRSKSRCCLVCLSSLSS